MNDSSEPVWIPQARHGGGYSVYHTNPDCVRLKQAGRPREKTLDTISPRLRECKVCADEVAEKTHPETRVCDVLENLSATGIDLTGGEVDG